MSMALILLAALSFSLLGVDHQLCVRRGAGVQINPPPCVRRNTNEALPKNSPERSSRVCQHHFYARVCTCAFLREGMLSLFL